MYRKRTYCKIQKLFTILFLCIFLMLSLSICSFAAGSVTVDEEVDITMQGILNSEALDTLKTITATLVNPIASVAMGAALLSLAFAGDSRQAENAVKTIKSIVIAFVITNCLGLILTGIGSVVGTHAYTFQ